MTGLRIVTLAATSAFVSMIAAAGCGSSSDSGFGNGTSYGPGTGNGTGGDGGGTFGGGTSGDGGGGTTVNWGDAGCAGAAGQSFRTPIYMEMVLDGSWSMDGIVNLTGGGQDFLDGSREVDSMNPMRPALCHNGQRQICAGETGKKWLAARNALISFWDQRKQANDNNFGVGFYLFSSTGSTQRNWSRSVDLKVVDAAQDALLKSKVLPEAQGGTTIYPNNGTPLCESITSQGSYLSSFTPTAPLATNDGKRVLVVITDGVPDANSENQSVCLAQATSLSQRSIRTFVIGVGELTAATSDYDPKFLNQLAVNGGADTTQCDPNWTAQSKTTPCHFQITPSENPDAAALAQKFTQAIEKIRQSLGSCTLPLTKPAGAPAIDPTKVNVEFVPSSGAKQPLTNDPTNGWTYDNTQNPTKVVLHGNSCNNFLADSGSSIEIVVGCQTTTTGGGPIH